jgi:hypothetical protein
MTGIVLEKPSFILDIAKIGDHTLKFEQQMEMCFFENVYTVCSLCISKELY